MQKRHWYSLNQEINPLGFGCWQLSGEYYLNGKPQGWGSTNEKHSIRLIHEALNSGIQFFDTASTYGNGKSEEALGKAISSSLLKEEAIICTKIPLTNQETNNLSHSEDLKEQVNASLKRLKRETIDILLVHNPPDSLNWKQFDQSILLDLKNEGKIRSFGVSNRSILGAKNVIDANFGSCIEWVFNLLERRPIQEIFPLLESSKINFIARSPLSRGLLSPKYFDTDPFFAPDDFRTTLPENWVQWIIDSIRTLDLTEDERLNIANIAIQYCLSFKEMSVVIPGIKTISYLRDILTYVKENNNINRFLDQLNHQTEDCFPDWK